MEQEMKTMGKRIMALRREKGLTQEQLADKVGVSAQAVSKWENELSCPDVSILPQLADALGVTTDELLGARPIEPRVVVVEKGASGGNEARTAGGVRREIKRDGIGFAVLVIVLGVSFLLNKLNVMNTNIWNIVWPAVLIGLGISWCISRFSPFALAVGALGLYYLLFNLNAVTYQLTWGVIWPILVIVIGLSILVDCVWPNRGQKWTKSGHGCGKEHSPVSEYSEEGGFVRYECSFSEENRCVNGERFNGANIEISFGKSVLDLTRVTDFAPGASVHAKVSFGCLELLVPRTVVVEQVSRKSFGAVQTEGMPDSTAAASIRLDGEVAFGSAVIHYV